MSGLSSASCSVTLISKVGHTTGTEGLGIVIRKRLLYDLFPETTLTRKSVHPDVSLHSHLPCVKPVSSCLSLEDMGHFLQGFHIHPAEMGIKTSQLLTCLLAGDLRWAQCQPRQEGTSLPWLSREVRPLANPIRAILPVVQIEKLSPRDKKGAFPTRP